MKYKVPEHQIQDGSFERPYIKSSMTREEIEQFILDVNPEAKEVWDRQELVTVKYLDKGGNFCEGQIVVDKNLADEVKEFFDFCITVKYQIYKIVPIQNQSYKGEDNLSMKDNNSSAMNFRYIAGTNRLSLHSFGFAIDINPWDNPVVKNGEVLEPQGAEYKPEDEQTLNQNHPVVKWLEERGWEWGGTWGDDPYSDNHHFQKPFATEQYLDELEKQLVAGKITESDYEHRKEVAQRNSQILNNEKV